MIAEDEIEKTAVEAGKSAAAVHAGDVEYFKLVSEELVSEVTDLKKENKNLKGKNKWLKRGITVTGGLSVGAVIFALLSGS
jgi:hypothetical protein